MAVRLLIVDDHPIVRRGLSHLLRQQPDLTVVGEAGSLEGAVQAIAALPMPPDVAIVDLGLGHESGLRLIPTLAATWPTVGILVLSMHDETLHAERALAAGARGYIMKDAAAQTLTAAVRRVAAGATYVSDAVAARIVSRAARRGVPEPREPRELLSAREREVFALLGRGLSTRGIAAACSVSVKTVETHQARIKEKLGLHNGHELVRTAVAWSAD